MILPDGTSPAHAARFRKERWRLKAERQAAQERREAARTEGARLLARNDAIIAAARRADRAELRRVQRQRKKRRDAIEHPANAREQAFRGSARIDASTRS